MNIDGSLQLNDLGGILRRRGTVMAAVALCVALAGYWLAMALPNVYTSYATVLVEPQAVAEDLVSAGVADSDLNQRLHLMTARILSRPRLSRIIDDEDLYQKESRYMLREEIIDLMRRNVRVEPVIPDLEQGGRRRDLEINEFRIYFDDYDPIVARDVAQRLANDFIETHINKRVEVSQKSLDFIETELDRLGKRIEKIENRIAQVKNENPGKLPDDMNANQRRLERVLGDLTAAQRALSLAASDEAFYTSQVALAKLMGAPNDDASPVRRLELLKLTLADLESRGFTDKHPDIIKTRLEIEQIQQTLDEAAGTPGALLNPVAQTTEAQARRAALQRVAGEQELQRLQLLGEEIQARIEASPAVAEKLDGLNREYQHLFDTFQDYSKRHNEASVQAQLERRQLGEQFRVLEAAFEAPEPSAPNRVLILIAGAVLGAMLGVGAGVLLEALDTSVHDARQLQTSAQLPVLASIPQIWLETDRVSQRRARIRTALATVGVVGFALVGGAANYLYVNGMPRFLAAPPAASDQAETQAAVDEG